MLTICWARLKGRAQAVRFGGGNSIYGLKQYNCCLLPKSVFEFICHLSGNSTSVNIYASLVQEDVLILEVMDGTPLIAETVLFGTIATHTQLLAQTYILKLVVHYYYKNNYNVRVVGGYCFFVRQSGGTEQDKGVTRIQNKVLCLTLLAGWLADYNELETWKLVRITGRSKASHSKWMGGKKWNAFVRNADSKLSYQLPWRSSNSLYVALHAQSSLKQ